MHALEQGFDQIVIFGAGLDSRAQCFGKLNKKTEIFELDAPIAQGEKPGAFREKNIMVPENLTYVPIRGRNEPSGVLYGGGTAKPRIPAGH